MIGNRKACVLPLALWFAVLGAGCAKKQEAAPSHPPVPVTTAVVTQQAMPVQVRAIGTVEAVSSVTVKSMVAGEITEVHFKEGQDVRKGDLLFTIDRRPFEVALQQAEANHARDGAALKQAEANLTRDIAQANNARAEAGRYEKLFKQGIIAQDQYDRMRTSFEALDAAVAADRAAIENTQAALKADEAAIANAKINLQYCSIRAPIDGRTGSLIAYQGTIVKSNDTTLININQVNPIYVNFALPQQYLQDVKKYMAQGTMKVQALSASQPGAAEEGRLTFVDNAVDSQTGTIKLKGSFPNSNRLLWPGQFVDVALTLTTEPNAIVVPSAAVQTGQTGQFVYVVKADSTAESRPVVIRRAAGDSSVVDKGLQPGERVVTDGQLRLVPGAKVVEGKGGEKATKEARS